MDACLIFNIAILRTYNFFPHWEDTLVGYHWNLYHIQVRFESLQVSVSLMMCFQSIFSDYEQF